MTKKIVLTLMGAMLFISSISVASVTSKTLPEGVWKFNLYYNQFDVTKAGANKSGDSSNLTSWETVDLDAGVMGDIPVFHDLNAALQGAGGVNLNTPLIHNWTKKQVNFDLAYGVNNRLSLFTNLTFEDALLDYTDAYVAEMSRLNAIVDSEVVVPPDDATSSEFRDIFVGFKYKLKDNMAFTFRSSFGPLRIGTSASEKNQSDGIQELETGKDHDTYQFLLNYDKQTPFLPLNFLFGYVHMGQGFQVFLDNTDVHIEMGDLAFMSLGSTHQLGQKFSLDGKLTYLYKSKDQYKGGSISGVDGTDAYQSVPSSDGTFTYADIQFNYLHKQFLHFFVGGNWVLAAENSGQLYESPGRLETGMMVRAGATLYYK